MSFTLPKGSSDQRTLFNLSGSAQGYYIAQSCAQTKRPILVICDSIAQAQALEVQTQFYLDKSITTKQFVDWETLPYDQFSPHQDIISERIELLASLSNQAQQIIFCSVNTLLTRLPPSSFIAQHSFCLKLNQVLDVEHFRNNLVQAGYQNVEAVYEHGDFAVRGAIIDVFPMGSEFPVRIERFDDEIDTLRYFDPETQRSLEKISELVLLPGKEFSLTKESVNSFRSRFREQFAINTQDCPLYQDIIQGVVPAGIEYYLPLFFDQTQHFFDYLNDDWLVICSENLERSMDKQLADIHHRYENQRHNIVHPILPPESLYFHKEEFFKSLKQFARLNLSTQLGEDKPAAGKYQANVDKSENFYVDSTHERPLILFENHFLDDQKRMLICAESLGRREILLGLFKRQNLTIKQVNSFQEFLDSTEPLCLTVAPLDEGLVLPELNIEVICEPQLFGQFIVQQRQRKRSAKSENPDLIVKNLTELNIGAPVVHLDHGVGRYLGLQSLEVDGQVQEFLQLEYASDAKLYVPVGLLHLISRYSASEEASAPLHRLGTEKWSTAKRKAVEKIRDTAAELLNIYAKREAKQGYAFKPCDADYREFAQGFAFEETPDQEAAINAVIQDMCRTRPMDRLVCGDVGFGKTEVAIRAAFLAAQSGKQVAILVPTTLLAQQHFENFSDRFANWPINIGLLSRFTASKVTKQTLLGLESGTIDIVIGTHKLLSADVKFKDLGLLVIDEEHRFGVQQKEKVKALRADIDILTLTATPIPRTLNMSMSAIRDLSIIATPPARRLSVKTFVREYDDDIIKESILREILRGGQIYFLHNSVKDIEKTKNKLQELIPEARIGIGHGQMNERELERVMQDFYHRRFNVLLCTTIIETGIDIPSANTIIIERADKFGLAQLHQLRGRVGRSHHQAYCYMLTPPAANLTKDAIKRLEAIEGAQDLGAGFTLATHDLEIRGAGELLGEDQTGHIEGIGFSLYMDMLEKAVNAIKNGQSFDINDMDNHGPEINLRLAAIIDADYVPDINMRLSLYKRISSCKTENELNDLQIEMIDRFGLLTDPCKNLFKQTALKLQVEPLGIKKIDMGDKGGTIEFSSQTTIDPFILVQLIQSMPQMFKLNKGDQLKFFIESEKETRFERLNEILKLISKKPNS
ncbi:transcription-repair coupling factor [Marinicellulosiphila megalodicopiae]|uniref:transcription-repair coupling factor n=1 Tax=Marinicellulosiphila megalodicopiae TaxID=2724896 RepID=UPI003BAF5590